MSVAGHGLRAVPGSPHSVQAGMLVVGGLILGLLLWRVTDDGTLPAGRGPAASTGSTSTTTLPARPATLVRVLVLNGSGRPNQAGILSERLAGAGYPTLPAGNAARQPDTVVHFRPGFDREAEVLAGEAGASRVEPFLSPDQFPGAQGADCVVVIGTG